MRLSYIIRIIIDRIINSIPEKMRGISTPVTNRVIMRPDIDHDVSEIQVVETDDKV